ncbi:MAG TPA: hypothetical protein VGJ14_07525 [Sporichthyaceae bacterium]|jgi:hypothetical protein
MKFFAPAAAVAAVAGMLSMAAPASAAEQHRTVTVNEHDNHATITVHKGDRIRVVLHNTYWSIERAHGHALKARGPQKTAGQMGAGCIPGAGCGTVTRTFIADHRGTARLVAGRTTCGEAMRCTGDQGSFRVTIHVVR